MQEPPTPPPAMLPPTRPALTYEDMYHDEQAELEEAIQISLALAASEQSYTREEKFRTNYLARPPCQRAELGLA